MGNPNTKDVYQNIENGSKEEVQKHWSLRFKEWLSELLPCPGNGPTDVYIVASPSPSLAVGQGGSNSGSSNKSRPPSSITVQNRGYGGSSKIQRPPSLTNDGATCYLNSAFQGISACNIFVEDINTLCEKNNAVENLYVFKELMAALNGCSSGRMSISRNRIFSNWKKGGQQDCYELLAYALNQVYNELRSRKESNGEIPKRDLVVWLKETLPMRLILQYIITCGCKHVTNSPLQSDLALHVTIPKDGGKIKLNDLIDHYFEEDDIEGYECDQRGCNGSGTKRIARLVKPLPRTVCIHLQRSYWNGHRMVKINNDVPFDVTLTLKSSYLYNPPQNERTISDLMASDQNVIKGDTCTTSKEIDHISDISPACDHVAEIQINQGHLGKEDSGGDSDVDTLIVDQNIGILEDSCKNASENHSSDEIPSKEVNNEPIALANVDSTSDNGDHNCSIDRSTSDPTWDSNNVNQGHLEEKDSGEDSDVDTPNIKHTISEDSCIPISQNHSSNDTPCDEITNKAIASANVDSTSCISNRNCPIDGSTLNSSNISPPPSPENDEGDKSYRLVSVIVHSGTVSGGHYICYKRVGDSWFLTNDSWVHEAKESEVLRCSPYVLFYEQYCAV